jgi:putative ABC transport system permease protein
VFRLDANRDAGDHASGTGGFALIGDSTIPVIQDLSTAVGQDALGLGPKDLPGASIVPFRVRRGDDASCLNLNRAQKPRLLGVRPGLLKGRFTVTGAGWELLKAHLEQPEEVPAIGDAASIQWALGLKVGDALDYTEESGRTFKLRLVGAVANSILQGSLVIDEAQFVKKFPGASGYQMFLVDAPPESVGQVSATLSRTLTDAGLELTRATDKLNAFNAVQNTYLGTFQVLGGLGLLLGSAGLGIIVLRNVLERRAELAVLLAVGFRHQSLEAAVLGEHALLLCAGLGLGVFAAGIAVLPALPGSGTGFPIRSLALTLAAVLVNGFVWTWIATRVATRGNLLAALRNE